MQYAADLYYRVGAGGVIMMIRIETWPEWNRSSCTLEKALPYVCSAGGDSIDFVNKTSG